MLTAEDLDLCRRLDVAALRRNGVPAPDLARHRERGFRLVSERLGSQPVRHMLRVSPLGPGWSSDIDVHLAADLDPTLLWSWGWLPLDELLRRLGIRNDGRWAAVHEHAVVAAVDLQVSKPPDPVSTVLRRCLRRGEVRLREVLELRVLLRNGNHFPVSHPALTTAADLEAALGGSTLGTWRSGRSTAAPAPLRARRIRRGLRRALGRARRPRLVVAVSGSPRDGTAALSHGLRSDLETAGVPATVLPASLGAGLPRLPPWLSSTAATLSLLVRVWPRYAVARGVVIVDDDTYRDVKLALPPWLVPRLLPRATLTLGAPADANDERPLLRQGRLHVLDGALTSRELREAAIRLVISDPREDR